MPSLPTVDNQPLPVGHSREPVRTRFNGFLPATKTKDFQVFALEWPLCSGQMCLIAFVTDGTEVRKISQHIGVHAQAPRTTSALGPPLWDMCHAQMQESEGVEPEWDISAQAALSDRSVHQLVNGEDERLQTRPGLGARPRPAKPAERVGQAIAGDGDGELANPGVNVSCKTLSCMTLRAMLPSSDAIEFPIRFHQSPLSYVDKGQVPPAVVEGDAELRQS